MSLCASHEPETVQMDCGNGRATEWFLELLSLHAICFLVDRFIGAHQDQNVLL